MQAQAMLQTLLNRIAFGMDPQSAVEAPRFATYSFPDSFEPHSILPGSSCSKLVCRKILPIGSRASVTKCNGGPIGRGRPAQSV